ncbi:MAG: Tetraacyldisaccharide 4'-kinase [Alphaproteobacteria bacterium ADurb.Bin438]|nr:MAG: Tetraacyldisaccharide 4'-kinase [Alphaproteobacteria bacterium ADurb.Bin438]
MVYKGLYIIDRFLKKTYNSKLKIICVGNVVVGGSGKTPIAIKIAKILIGQGFKVAFLSRGYKGKLDKVLVDDKKHSSKDVGDEPLLLCKIAPVVISKNRGEGAKIAEENGFEYLIMDDGFQNFTLKKDISILVFDGSYGVGNKKLLPAGPLREDLDKALLRADFAIVSGKDKVGIKDLLKNKIEILKGEIIPDYQVLENLKNKKVIGFAGIGRPLKFYDTLKQNGIEVVDFISFPDHHDYNEKDMDFIFKKAYPYGASVVTTTKDYVKIPLSYKENISFLPIEFSFFDDTKLLKAISK